MNPRFCSPQQSILRQLFIADRLASVESADDDGSENDEDVWEEPLACVQARLWKPLAPLSKAASDPESPLPDEIVWMPAGCHLIQAGELDGGSINEMVNVDQEVFARVQASFDEMATRGERPWIDFDHSDRPDQAAAYVTGFRWDPERGIMAKVEWTPDGEDAVRSLKFTRFSPAFGFSRLRKSVMGLLDGGHAAGGLVNEPAFPTMPLLAT